MDIVFLQDTQLRTRSAACKYDAVSRYDVKFLNNEKRGLSCLGSYLMILMILRGVLMRNHLSIGGVLIPICR